MHQRGSNRALPRGRSTLSLDGRVEPVVILKRLIVELYVGSVTRAYILERVPVTRFTFVGFHPPIWADCVALVMLATWALRGCKTYVATPMELTLMAIVGTVLTYLLTRGVQEDPQVRILALRDESDATARRLRRGALIAAFYVCSILLVYFTLTRAVWITAILSR